jgi:hypothetical protein
MAPPGRRGDGAVGRQQSAFMTGSGTEVERPDANSPLTRHASECGRTGESLVSSRVVGLEGTSSVSVTSTTGRPVRAIRQLHIH